MSRVILALLVIVAVAYAIPKHPFDLKSCDENEEYVTCGTACEPSCDTAKTYPCTLQCVIGCQCKAGFLRDDENGCVHPSKCNKKSSNEI